MEETEKHCEKEHVTEDAYFKAECGEIGCTAQAPECQFKTCQSHQLTEHTLRCVVLLV